MNVLNLWQRAFRESELPLATGGLSNAKFFWGEKKPPLVFELLDLDTCCQIVCPTHRHRPNGKSLHQWKPKFSPATEQKGTVSVSNGQHVLFYDSIPAARMTCSDSTLEHRNDQHNSFYFSFIGRVCRRNFVRMSAHDRRWQSNQQT